MKHDHQNDWESVARRNESDIRMVSGIVGVFSGAFLALAVLSRLYRHAHHVPVWVWLVIPFIGAVIGGGVGYFKDTWR